MKYMMRIKQHTASISKCKVDTQKLKDNGNITFGYMHLYCMMIKLDNFHASNVRCFYFHNKNFLILIA